MINNVMVAYETFSPLICLPMGQRRISRAEEKRDVVAFSSIAKDAIMLRKALENIPDVRADKVSDLSDRIKNKNYYVNSSMIADKILKNFNL